jgi:hypothetical protein
MKNLLEWRHGYFVFEDGRYPILECIMIGKSVNRDESGHLYHENPGALVGIKPEFDLPELHSGDTTWPAIRVSRIVIKPTGDAPWWWPFRYIADVLNWPIAATASASIGDDALTPLTTSVRVIGLGTYCKTKAEAEKEDRTYAKFLRQPPYKAK